MQFNIKAAWLIDGKVYAGSSHENILHSITEITCECTEVVHGYIDCAGRFCKDIEELLDMQELMLIRHAQTLFNIRQSNDLDSDLTDVGEQQTVMLGDHLKTFDFSEYVGLVSPALRTLKTARRIHETTGLPFAIHPLAYEYCAPWRDMSGVVREYKAIIPCREKEFPEFDWSLCPKNTIFNQEPLSAFMQRMKGLASSLSKKTVIVSHGAVVFTMLEGMLGQGSLNQYGHEPVTNGSISLLHGDKAVSLFHTPWRD